MEFVNNNKLKYLFILFLGLNLFSYISGQGFQGIVPLQSNCDDVKEILKVEKCKFPKSIYKTNDFDIRIQFTKLKPSKKDRVCWNVPARTVLSVNISFKKSIKVTGFEFPLTFVKGPIDDVFTMLYENKQRNIKAYVINNLLSEIEYVPSELNRKNLSYSCKSPDAGDDFKEPIVWIERYWKTQEKSENVILDYAIKEFKNQLIYKHIYLVYYYKCEKDKVEGLKQVRRAKSYLEKQGFPSDKIRIYNGGKKNKSEIVIYLAES